MLKNTLYYLDRMNIFNMGILFNISYMSHYLCFKYLVIIRVPIDPYCLLSYFYRGF